MDETQPEVVARNPIMRRRNVSPDTAHALEERYVGSNRDWIDSGNIHFERLSVKKAGGGSVGHNV